MAMVKLIVLDVDGVIVGHKVGVNFPLPNEKVISSLKKIREQGIPIVLCSGKYNRAIEPIIFKAHLNNPHITDAGSLILDPLAKKIIHAYTLDKQVASDIAKICLQNGIHIEAYSTERLFMQKDKITEMLHHRIKILQVEPVLVDSLIETINQQNIIKLLPVVTTSEEKKKLENLLMPFRDKANLVWSMHPATKPWEYYLITALDVSKGNSVKEVAQDLEISLDDTLGVGDTLGDWEFMKLCGYTATMGDAPEELKKLCQFTGPSVDEDGILKIFETMLESK